MAVIRDLETDENGWFTTGKFDSEAFLPGETEVMIFTDDGAGIEDAERCIGRYNALRDEPEVFEEIETRFTALTDAYKKWVRFLVKHRAERTERGRLAHFSVFGNVHSPGRGARPWRATLWTSPRRARVVTVKVPP